MMERHFSRGTEEERLKGEKNEKRRIKMHRGFA